MTNADDLGIGVVTVQTEAHERIGAIERSHALLRSTYAKLRQTEPEV